MFLEISGLTKNFGGLTAVNQFDMYVNKGEIVGLIGPNGAGKTTLFNLITGVLRPTKGKVIFDGEDVTGPNSTSPPCFHEGFGLPCTAFDRLYLRYLC